MHCRPGSPCVVMFGSEEPTEVPQADSNSTELTTWDFLQDLDFGPEPDAAIFAVPQEAACVKASNSERLKEKNRKAQKRFRERKKVSKSCQVSLGPQNALACKYVCHCRNERKRQKLNLLRQRYSCTIYD